MTTDNSRSSLSLPCVSKFRKLTHSTPVQQPDNVQLAHLESTRHPERRLVQHGSSYGDNRLEYHSTHRRRPTNVDTSHRIVFIYTPSSAHRPFRRYNIVSPNPSIQPRQLAVLPRPFVQSESSKRRSKRTVNRMEGRYRGQGKVQGSAATWNCRQTRNGQGNDDGPSCQRG